MQIMKTNKGMLKKKYSFSIALSKSTIKKKNDAKDIINITAIMKTDLMNLTFNTLFTSLKKDLPQMLMENKCRIM